MTWSMTSVARPLTGVTFAPYAQDLPQRALTLMLSGSLFKGMQATYNLYIHRNSELQTDPDYASQPGPSQAGQSPRRGGRSAESLAIAARTSDQADENPVAAGLDGAVSANFQILRVAVRR